MFRLGQLAEHTYLIKAARCQYFVNKYEIFWSLHHLTTFPAVLDTHFIRISQFWDKAIFDPKTKTDRLGKVLHKPVDTSVSI